MSFVGRGSLDRFTIPWVSSSTPSKKDSPASVLRNGRRIDAVRDNMPEMSRSFVMAPKHNTKEHRSSSERRAPVTLSTKAAESDTVV